MFLPYEEAMSFIDGYKATLLEILKSQGENQTGRIVNDLAKARSFVKNRPQLIDEAIERIKSQGTPLSQVVEASIRSIRIGRWIYLRNTTKYALILDEKLTNAYAVKALTTPLHEVAGNKSAIFEAALFEYDGIFLCDGIVANAIHIGPGLRSEFGEKYKSLKKLGHFYTQCAA
jgi:hypothetical protein